MEIVVNREAIYRSLQFIQTITDKKNIMPILSNVLLYPEASTLRLSATDLEVSVDYSIPVETRMPGRSTVLARKLFEIVKELPPSDVVISCDENYNVKIVCKSILFKLKGLPHEEFPKFPDFDWAHLSVVESQTLREMIDKTIYAVSGDDVQFNLSGIFVEKTPGMDGVRFVATDGHRLSLIDRDLVVSLPQERSVILPRKGLLEIRKILQDHDGEVSVGINENHLVLRSTDVTLYIRLIDGVFPNYKEVIPKFSSKSVRIRRSDLLEALRRASIVSVDRFRGVRIELDRNVVRVSSNNPDIGESEERVEAEYVKEPFAISFNSRYIMDVLAALTSEIVVVEANDEASPVVIRDTNDERFLSVIMPMRL